MATIEKKVWPRYFKRLVTHKQNVTTQLSTSKIKKGDTMILKEWNPKNQNYTGRFLKRKVRAVTPPAKLLDHYSLAKLRKDDFYLIEL